jgi:hypothetical protein
VNKVIKAGIKTAKESKSKKDKAILEHLRCGLTIQESLEEEYGNWGDDQVLDFMNKRGDEFMSQIDDNIEPECPVLDTTPIYNMMADRRCPHCDEQIHEKGVGYTEDTNQFHHRQCGKPINMIDSDTDLSRIFANLMNEFMEVDKEAIDFLVARRIASLFGDHPHVMVTEKGEIGFLGLINGILGSLGYESICCQLDDEDRLEGFDVYKKPMTEAQNQGTIERVHRRTRLPKVTPASKDSRDLTPRKPANNDPTKTGRGKNALKRQIKKNKRNAHKFKTRYSEAVELFDSLRPDGSWKSDDLIAESVSKIEDPIAAHKLAVELSSKDVKFGSVAETIHNIFEDQLIELTAAVCNAGKIDEELESFEKAQSLLSEIKDWGAPFMWIERFEKNGVVIYKAVGDYPPSAVYEERCGDKNRTILPHDADKSKIIQVVYGD